MSDLPPEPNNSLDPANQKWGKWVSNAIAILFKRIEEKYSADINNGFKATGGSIEALGRTISSLQEQASLLADQVNYLNGFKTYSKTLGRTTGITWTGDNSGLTWPNPGITFELTERRRVSITLTAEFDLIARFSGNSGWSSAAIKLLINGDEVSTGNVYLSHQVLSGGGSASWEGPAIVTYGPVLNPGVYTIDSIVDTTAFGTPFSGGSASDAYLTVQVLDRA